MRERDLQDKWGERKTRQQLEEYMLTKNSRSIDGLPARPARHDLVGVAGEEEHR